jgi:hypothetical protein
MLDLVFSDVSASSSPFIHIDLTNDKAQISIHHISSKFLLFSITYSLHVDSFMKALAICSWIIFSFSSKSDIATRFRHFIDYKGMQEV